VVAPVAVAARFAALLACATSSVAAAQTAADKATVIRLRYVTIENRLRPNPESGIRVERTIVARLSPGGEVEEETAGKARRHSADFSMSGRLGGEQSGAGWDPVLGRVRWRVVDSGTLMRVRELEQNVQTITVRVHGSTCEMTFADELKPGFSDVRNHPLGSRETAYFSVAKLAEASCAIE